MDDCLIIGGGVIGLSIAFDLVRHGLRIRVVDRGEPGHEASWAGAGILPPANLETAEHPYDQLHALSYQLHPVWAKQLLDETGIDTGFRRCGGIYVARSLGEGAALVAFANMLNTLGVQVERLGSDELTRLEPNLKPLADSGRVAAAFLLPDEAQLRNPRHVRALSKACVQRGVKVEGHVAVRELTRHGKRIQAVISCAGELRADRYCVCSGAWTHELLQQLRISTGIYPVRGQMVLFHSPTPLFHHVLNEGSRYLVPRDDGRVLAGSTEEEAGFDKRTTNEAIHDLSQFAYDLVPALRDARIEMTWAGLRPASFDGFPYLGTIPGLENAYLAAGHFRSGLLLSTGTAHVMGQLIRSEKPDIDLTPFRVGRG